MRKELLKSLITDIYKFLKPLNFMHDNNTPLRIEDIIYFLVDYDSYDFLSEQIDDLEENEKFYQYTKNGTKDFPTIILEHPELFKVLIEKSSIEKLLNKKTRDFQSCYCNGSSNLTETKLEDILQGKIEELTYLCKHYLVSTSPSTYTMLINLFDQCILYLITPDFSHTAPRMIQNAVFQMNAANQFANFIMEHRKVIISGMHGTGKSVFIAHFLKEYHCDYLYLSYKNSLQTTLHQKIFSDCNGTKKNLSKLLEKPSNSVLIIDDMNPDKESFIQEAQNMSKYNLCIIILTIHSYCPKGYKSFTESYYKNSDNYKNNNTISKQLDDAMNFTNQNPYLLSLLTITKQKQPDFHVSDLYHNAMELSADSTLPKFKHPYHKVYADFWGHAYKLYDLQHYTKDYQKHRKHLKILSCFFNHQVPLHFLKDIFDEYDNQCISDLINMGYLNHTVIDSSDIVWLSPALANIIFHHEKPAYTDALINPIIEKLTNTLATFQNSLQLSLLEDILYPFALRLGNTVRQKNNAMQKNVSTAQEKWWDFLYLAAEYYQVMNKPDIALKLLSFIAYPENMAYTKSSYDTLMINILTAWITGDTDSFLNNVDTVSSVLANHIQSDEAEKMLPIGRYLACNSLDYLICRELTNIFKEFENVTTNDSALSYTYFCNFMDILKAETNFYAKYPDYDLIYHLLFTDVFVLDYVKLTEYLKIIDSYPNITQKIRNLCVFVHTCSKKFVYEYLHYLGYNGEYLIQFINSAFSKLKSEISSVVILPGLLGQMCSIVCSINILFQASNTAFTTDFPSEILSLIQEKTHTFALSELDNVLKKYKRPKLNK